jgi:DNA repair exonuclease SbcCD ATPase subunit
MPRLEASTQTLQSAESQRLSNEISRGKQALQVAADQEREAERLQGAYNKAAERLGAVLKEAEAVVGTLPGGVDPATALETEEVRLMEELASLRNAHGKREEQLQDLDNAIDRLRVLHKFLKTEADFASVQAKPPNEDTEGNDAIQHELGALLSLQESLEIIAHAINSVAKARAIEALAMAHDEVDTYYKRLCSHPYFDGIQILVEDKSLRGIQKNSYSIQTFSTADGKKTLASSRLSAAQMNCVALSVYLALAGTLTHNLGFVVLDDPSQSLDADHKAALAHLLKEIVPAVQLVVGTQDVELHEFLTKEFSPECSSTYRLAWTPRSGTEIRPTR